jgi:uncharacterized protein
VSATLTFDYPSRLPALLAARFILGFYICLGLLTSPLLAADDGERETGFFSYFPATPELRFPKIDIVPFWTSDLKTGRRAYRDGDFERAMRYFREASEDGNVTADWYLGHMYRLGRGVPRNPSIAYTYYSRVAESYDPEEPSKTRLRIAVDSELRLALFERQGIANAGIPPNPHRAARTFLRLASNYGHPLAMFALGEMSLLGDGVQKNPQQGLKWLMAAARKRNPEAEALLGDIYERGEYVRPDETRSLMWYLLAAENASDIEHPHIKMRAKQKYVAASQDMRLEADSRAKVWAEQFPSAKNQD